MNKVFKEEFSNHLKTIHTSPYLFIGSGLSNRYLKIGSWESLLENVCKKIEMPKDFNYYYSQANQDLPKVANIIGNSFFDTWWNNDKFDESRNKFSSISNSKSSPLKFEISNYIIDKGVTPIPEYLEEYNLFRKINIDGIITTNWDLLLENTFSEFNTFIGQDNLIFNNSIDIGEIYKIHGCISKPNSLVLTDEDYENFNKKYPYLAAKLLTIFMEHPIIFIGYNIGDANVQEILKSIIYCLNRENIDKLKDRLIFCERDESVIETTFSNGNILIEGTNLPIKSIKYNSLIDVFTVLSDNKRKLPIKVLKNMKNMIYDFVKKNKSKSKIYVVDDYNIEDVDIAKAQFVYGFDIKEQLSEKGIKGINMQDLLIDSILNNNNYNPISISKHVLPKIQGKYIPFFKYLRNANLLNEKGEIPTNDDIIELNPSFIAKINSITIESFYPTGSYFNKLEEINKYKSISELVASEDLSHSMIYITMLNQNKIDIQELYSFIKDNYEKNINNTNMRKIICLHDYLKYKLQVNSK